MSDSPPREGSTLGPYHLDRLYPDSDPTLGHVYEAHHTVTGARALVLVPDAFLAWEPRSSWTVRSSSHTAPPFVAVEVEHSPGDSTQAVHDLTLLYIRLSAAMASVEDREDTARFLSQTPKSTPRTPRRRRVFSLSLATLAGVVMGVGAVLLWPRVLGRSDLWAAETVAGESVAWTNAPEDSSPISYPMPSAPLPGQQKPPCRSDGIYEVNGGCWVRLEQKAPCPKGFAEHEGRCYMPIREKPPVPRSVKP